MRVLSILAHSPPTEKIGGAERQMHSLHKGLLARGVEVNVLADIKFVGREFQEYEGIRIWGVPFPILTSHPLRPGNIRIWRTWQTIKRSVSKGIPDIDLIQVTPFRQPALIAHWLSNTLCVPWVARLACSGIHGDIAFQNANWLSKRAMPAMIDSVSQVIALDDETRLEALAAGVPDQRISIIPNGLLLNELPDFSSQRPEGQRSEITFVGRLDAQKRVETLLDSFAQVRALYPSRRLNLTIAGTGQQESFLEERSNRIGLLDDCSFLGAVDGPKEVLSRSRCFVNPSESEGLPSAVLEAIAFGVPIVLSDLPIHRQLARAVSMEDFIFPVGDTEALTHRLADILDLSEERLRAYREKCSSFRQLFSAERRDSAYIEIYRRILASRGSRR